MHANADIALCASVMYDEPAPDAISPPSATAWEARPSQTLLFRCASRRVSLRDTAEY